MSRTPVWLLVGIMLTSGSLNTILNKLQDLQCVANCDDEDPSKRHNYEQPVWQTLQMFLGESMCMLVFLFSLHFGTKAPERGGASTVHNETAPPSETTPLVPPVIDAASKPKKLEGWATLLMWIPCICDMTATTLMNVGLLFISASMYQMLRGAVVLFTGALSSMFLGRVLQPYRWFALVTVFLGVILVGASGLPGLSFTHVYNALVVEDNSNSLFGVSLLVFAQLFAAVQFVSEEKILSRYEVAPLQAVGLEGFFGLVTIFIGVPIAYLVYGRSGPPGNFFDVVAGYEQTFGIPVVLYAFIISVFSVPLFNWSGLSVTRRVSATARTTVDTCRTILVWAVSLGLGWEKIKVLQIIGFIVLIYGTFLFNDVISPPFCFAEPVQPRYEPVAENDD